MERTIDKDITLGELLERYPESEEILAGVGMHCFSCPMSRMETLEEAAEVHGVDLNYLLDELNAMDCESEEWCDCEDEDCGCGCGDEDCDCGDDCDCDEECNCGCHCGCEDDEFDFDCDDEDCDCGCGCEDDCDCDDEYCNK